MPMAAARSPVMWPLDRSVPVVSEATAGRLKADRARAVNMGALLGKPSGEWGGGRTEPRGLGRIRTRTVLRGGS
jgi:hypothetical protein